MYLRTVQVKVQDLLSSVSVNMPKMQYSDRQLHIFLPRSTNPTIRLVMSEAKPTGNSAKPARARLPSPSKTQLHNL